MGGDGKARAVSVVDPQQRKDHALPGARDRHATMPA